MKICLSLLAFFLFTSCAFAQSKNVSTPPEIVSIPAPYYPQAAKDAGIGGEVYVLVLINKKGTTKVADAYGPMAPCSNLDDTLTAAVQSAAVEAAKRATFVPATYNGKPVEKGFQLRYFFDPSRSNVVESSIGTRMRDADPTFTPAVAVRIPKAHYPETWGTIAGLVSVQLRVDVDGKVSCAGAISGNKELRRTSVEAACRATFLPATRHGKPVSSDLIIDHNFNTVYERF